MDDAAAAAAEAVDGNDVVVIEQQQHGAAVDAAADHNARLISFRVVLEDIGARIGEALINPTVPGAGAVVNSDVFLEVANGEQMAADQPAAVATSPPTTIQIGNASSPFRRRSLYVNVSSDDEREDPIVVSPPPVQSSGGASRTTRKRKRWWCIY